MKPIDYLESVRKFLLTDSRVIKHQIIREYEDVGKSYIRARLTLANESFLEFSEYIEQDSGDEIKITKYSYHWIGKDGKMLRRWDNTKHFSNLKNSRITFTPKQTKQMKKSYQARRPTSS